MIGITRVMVSESRSGKATARAEFRQWSRARKKSAEVEEVEQTMPPKNLDPSFSLKNGRISPRCQVNEELTALGRLP